MLSHNAVVQEKERGEEPVTRETSVSLSQKRKMFTECIQTLMAMGASSGTKVNKTLLHLSHVLTEIGPLIEIH